MIVKVLSRICEARRKVSPGYGAAEVLEAIYILSQEPVGRMKLARILGIGEASTRTMLKRLREENIVVIDPVAGAELSDFGRGFFAPLFVGVKIFEDKPRGLEDWGKVTVLAVHNMSRLLESHGVLVLRDLAIRSGARAAIVGVYDENYVFRAPGLEEMKELVRNLSLSLDKAGVLGGSLVIVLEGSKRNAYRVLARLLEIHCEAARK